MFKDNLKELRLKAGFKSAKQFAEYVKIPYTTYMGYENKNNWPPEENLFKMAAALHTDINTLVGYKPPADVIYKTIKSFLKAYGIDADIHPAFYDSIDYDTPVTLTTTLTESDNWLKPFYNHVHNAPLPLFDVNIAIQQAKAETSAAYSAVSKAYLSQRLQNYLFVKPTIDDLCALRPDVVNEYYQTLADKYSVAHLQTLKQYMELRQAGLEDFKIKKMFDEMYGDDKKEQPPHGTPIPGNGSE